LADLHKAGFINRYVVDGEPFIEIPKFAKHQNPHVRESESTIPAPDKHSASTGLAGKRLPLSSFLNPESLQPESNGDAANAAIPDETPVERRIWKDGVALLTSSGLQDRDARSLLGKMAKDSGKIELAKAIAATQAQNPADPKTYLLGILKPKALPAHVGKSEEKAPEPSCEECRDLKTIGVPDPDSEYAWKLIEVPCPECAAVAV
jgi:hypothetical protein